MRASIADACDACGRDPATVELLAVSKRHPVAAIREAHEAGQSVFGENRVQELVEKVAQVDVRFDLIGSLQTNKVKDLVPILDRVRFLHSLDRARLAKTLQEQLEARDPDGGLLDVLLQIDATGEANKHGVAPDAAESLARLVVDECPRLRLRGVMAMGPLEGDPGAGLRSRRRGARGSP